MQPGAGLFTQEDATRGMLDPYAYGYARLDPLRGTDPLGLWTTRVHNAFIHSTFANTLAPWEVYVLQQASADADKDQSLQGQYKHAMRGRGQDPEWARKQFVSFVCKRLRSARATSDRGLALYELGLGLHALTDLTSPSHGGFAAWDELTAGSALMQPGQYIQHYIADEIGFLWNEDTYAVTKGLMLSYYQSFLTGSPFETGLRWLHCDCR